MCNLQYFIQDIVREIGRRNEVLSTFTILVLIFLSLFFY